MEVVINAMVNAEVNGVESLAEEESSDKGSSSKGSDSLLPDILVTVKELVRQVSSLVKALGEKLTSVPATKESSGSFKPDVDEVLLKKLMHPQLIALYQ
jgi:hypothetical protein